MIPQEILNKCGSDLERLFAIQLWEAGEQTFLVQQKEPYVRNTLANKRSQPTADFIFPAERVVIEVQGDPWQGRHTRGAEYIKDCVKLRNAVLDGWWPLWFTTDDVKKTERALNETKELLKRCRNEGQSGSPVGEGRAVPHDY